MRWVKYRSFVACWIETNFSKNAVKSVLYLQVRHHQHVIICQELNSDFIPKVTSPSNTQIIAYCSLDLLLLLQCCSISIGLTTRWAESPINLLQHFWGLSGGEPLPTILLRRLREYDRAELQWELQCCCYRKRINTSSAGRIAWAAVQTAPFFIIRKTLLNTSAVKLPKTSAIMRAGVNQKVPRVPRI